MIIVIGALVYKIGLQMLSNSVVSINILSLIVSIDAINLQRLWPIWLILLQILRYLE